MAVLMYSCLGLSLLTTSRTLGPNNVFLSKPLICLNEVKRLFSVLTKESLNKVTLINLQVYANGDMKIK